LITAVDSNVLFELLADDDERAEAADTLLSTAQYAGELIICEAVLAEVAANFESLADLRRFTARTGVRLESSGEEALRSAGEAWRAYARSRSSRTACPQCGAEQKLHCTRCSAALRPRLRVLPDFIIGAHALHHADRLLTRDRRHYATYFPALMLITS
jgi:predicted nucleic acid-binding protein